MAFSREEGMVLYHIQSQEHRPPNMASQVQRWAPLHLGPWRAKIAAPRGGGGGVGGMARVPSEGEGGG